MSAKKTRSAQLQPKKKEEFSTSPPLPLPPNPTPPIPPQQPQHLPLAHRVLARQLQDAALEDLALALIRTLRARLSLASELEANAVRELLAVEVGRAGRLELREVELLARALLGGVRGGLLRGGRGEVQVAGFVEGEPAAFPELGG